METEDFIEFSSSNSVLDNKKRELSNSDQEPGEVDSQTSNLDVKEDNLKEKALGTDEADVQNGSGIFFPAAETDRDLNGSSVGMQVSAEVDGDLAVTVTEDIHHFSTRIPTEDDCFTVQEGSPIGRQKRDGSPVIEAIIGVKKARMTVDEQQPSVHVIYNSLTRESKQKLEELLQQWSEWHAQHCSPAHESIDLESGQETYFPAICVGSDNLSAVSFWMDNQPWNQQKEFIPLDSQSVPLYDRGYSLALTSTDSPSNLEGGLILDSSRCFNCGSYNHSLKDCPKPRDNVAVSNARKEHKSKRNQNSSFRNSARYYQNSPGGKYDGLKPGALDAETRQLLGLGELDPPPWLNRMREIGYPPGYLDPEEEDQPSGIIIFTEEESKEEKEDGEILETNINIPQPPRKMSVQFPGVNAPIPENADENRWAAAPSSSDASRNRSQRRGQPHEQRRSRDFRDEGPPGVDPGFSHSSSSYSERYGSYESSYSFQSARGNIPIPRSPSYGRSFPDRGRSHLYHEGSPVHGSYSSVPSPANRLFSPRSFGSPSYGRWEDNSRNDPEPYVSPHHHERYHSQSRR